MNSLKDDVLHTDAGGRAPVASALTPVWIDVFVHSRLMRKDGLVNQQPSSLPPRYSLTLSMLTRS